MVTPPGAVRRCDLRARFVLAIVAGVGVLACLRSALSAMNATVAANDLKHDATVAAEGGAKDDAERALLLLPDELLRSVLEQLDGVSLGCCACTCNLLKSHALSRAPAHSSRQLIKCTASIAAFWALSRLALSGRPLLRWVTAKALRGE